jgi:predicted negative regulator of RcsB-dependent stress response
MEKTETLEKVVNKTDFGHFINENAKAIIIGGVVTVLAVIGYSVVSNQADKANEAILSEIYQFEQSSLTALKEKKQKPEEFVQKFSELSSKLLENPAIVPTVIESVQFLRDQDKLVEAKSLLEKVYPSFGSHTYSSQFLAGYLAVIYEDLGKTKEAIGVLEKLVSSPVKILEAKIYLDLGRLYKAEGNMEKAKLNFQFVVDKFPKDELAKVAKLYLKELK